MENLGDVVKLLFTDRVLGPWDKTLCKEGFRYSWGWPTHVFETVTSYDHGADMFGNGYRVVKNSGVDTNRSFERGTWLPTNVEVRSYDEQGRMTMRVVKKGSKISRIRYDPPGSFRGMEF